jgi:23S rRNA (uracil1939-C5)-methyltransferase
MRMRKGQTIELAIDKMAYGGRGIGRSEGLVFFVRGGIPGDKVIVKVYKSKKDYAEASIVELLVPSPYRVEAPCRYNGFCGGCQWQHVLYERQLVYKREHVKESIEHIGGLRGVVVHETIPAQSRFGYRNKMEFSFSDRGWYLPDELYKGETGRDLALGLHVPGAYQKVIDIEACLLQQDQGNYIMKEVRDYVRESGIPVYGLRSHEGFWRYLTIRSSAAFDEWMVNLVTAEKAPEAVHPLAERLCKKIEKISTIVNNINRRKASIAVGQDEVILWGSGCIRDMIGPYTFSISPNSFFQTNPSGALRLYEKVVDYAELNGNESVIDLYSGTGTIPIFLAHKARQVIGIEINTDSVEDARANCRENGIMNCRFICGDIRRELSAVTTRPDVLIIDPPRAGMHKDVLAQVLELSPKRIAYVSCNPVTLARDLSQMVNCYEIIEIQPVDMFPHTYHVEAVANLRLRERTTL